jgi:predicted NACHT family NTPase
MRLCSSSTSIIEDCDSSTHLNILTTRLYVPIPADDSAPTDLDTAAQENRRLVIIGDPGSGKTTFLKHVAFRYCKQLSRARADRSEDLFPILIRVADLAEHIHRCQKQSGRPTTKESPAWLIDFLNAQNSECSWGLRRRFFKEKIASESCLLLLDGLDETPGVQERRSIVRLIENATEAFRRCRFVITTRPSGYSESTVLSNFAEVRIGGLKSNLVELFLRRWCNCQFPDSVALAAQHCDELIAALKTRPDLSRLARNPVMLTALAVVHWNEKSFPELRVEVYESIILWLVRARESRPGRQAVERSLQFLQHLALAMQTAAQGQLVQVERDWAVSVLAAKFAPNDGVDGRAWAASVIAGEEVDSGILVSRGNSISFWHRTFQEYLAARAISALPDRGSGHNPPVFYSKGFEEE